MGQCTGSRNHGARPVVVRSTVDESEAVLTKKKFYCAVYRLLAMVSPVLKRCVNTRMLEPDKRDIVINRDKTYHYP